MNDVRFEPPPYNAHLHLPVSNSQYQPHQHHYDLNNNNYPNDRTNLFYPSMQQQNIESSTANTIHHTHLGSQNNPDNNPNVLLLPPNQHPLYGGGSLPDLRFGNIYNNNQQQQQVSPQSKYD